MVSVIGDIRGNENNKNTLLSILSVKNLSSDINLVVEHEMGILASIEHLNQKYFNKNIYYQVRESDYPLDEYQRMLTHICENEFILNINQDGYCIRPKYLLDVILPLAEEHNVSQIRITQSEIDNEILKTMPCVYENDICAIVEFDKELYGRFSNVFKLPFIDGNNILSKSLMKKILDYNIYNESFTVERFNTKLKHLILIPKIKLFTELNNSDINIVPLRNKKRFEQLNRMAVKCNY